MDQIMLHDRLTKRKAGESLLKQIAVQKRGLQHALLGTLEKLHMLE